MTYTGVVGQGKTLIGKGKKGNPTMERGKESDAETNPNLAADQWPIPDGGVGDGVSELY